MVLNSRTQAGGRSNGDTKPEFGGAAWGEMREEEWCGLFDDLECGVQRTTDWC